MKQSRGMSGLEAVISTSVGFGISLGAQIVILPLLGVAIALHQNIVFAIIMTVISIARQYVMRRVFEALHIRTPLSPFALALLAERRRQVEAEGWTAEHDAAHRTGTLARAGACYARYSADVQAAAEDDVPFPQYRTLAPPVEWPWQPDWWKPHGFRRDLVRAGALIIAEGERFDRRKAARGRTMP